MNISQLIPFLNENQKDVKIHCATGNAAKGKNKLEPLFEYSKGKFKEWQEGQNQKNFERRYILSLIYIDKNEWLFAGIYQCLSVKQDTKENGKIYYKYKTSLLEHGKELIGKLVITFEKDFRASYLLLDKFINNLTICEIKKQEYRFDPFPGYSKVHITFDLLSEIINNNETSWKTSLSNVKGIYLISDKKTGKLYVGSASGDNGFWQRWEEYINNGHGGNKILKNIIKEKGINYCINYTFSILEICNKNVLEDEILEKESFWKNRLLTREFGYNDN
jgi:hypothetical protein